MPEGHSIRRLAHAFEAGFAGQHLAVSSPQGRFATGAEMLDGGALVTSRAWGKHLFLGFASQAQPSEPLSAQLGSGERGPDDGSTIPAPAELWLHVHLGLYGAWTFAGDNAFTGPHAIGAPRVRVSEEEVPVRETGAAVVVDADAGDGDVADDLLAGDVAGDPDVWQPPAPRGQVRVRLIGDHGVADLTGPTRCEVITTEQVEAVIAALGPDPLQPDPDGLGRERFVAAVRRSRVTVGALLMDQSVLAGVGNIYRAELLYRAKVHPLRTGSSLAARTLRGIWDDAVVLMADGVATGAIVTTDPADRVVPQDRWYVYHRDGRPCLRCGRIIAVDDLVGRKVYWCPSCQRRR